MQWGGSTKSSQVPVAGVSTAPTRGDSVLAQPSNLEQAREEGRIG